MTLTHFSLCTGGGGIDMAAEMAGFETVAQCEIDPYCNMILETRFSGLPYWEDINHVTARKFSKKTGIAPGELTLLSAGIPCQPHSVAGARKGSLDSRDLKDEAIRCIREIRPKWVLVENVDGMRSSDDGRYFRDFLGQLSKLGYDVGWCSYGAADVGAKHKRKRIGIVAYDTLERSGCVSIQQGRSRKTGGHLDGCGESMENSERAGFQEQGNAGISGGQAEATSNGSIGTLDNADSKRCEEFNTAKITSNKGGEHSKRTDGDEPYRQPKSGLVGTSSWLADWLDCVGWIADKGEAQQGIAYAWEPPRTAPGIANRAKRIHMIGNGVVPQWAYLIVKAIADIEVATCKTE